MRRIEVRIRKELAQAHKRFRPIQGPQQLNCLVDPSQRSEGKPLDVVAHRIERREIKIFVELFRILNGLDEGERIVTGRSYKIVRD